MMFKIVELLKQDTDAKFLDLFGEMNQKDFFFATPQSILSWTNRLTLYSSSRLSEIGDLLKPQEKGFFDTFSEMKKFCDIYFIKEIRSEIKASFEKWNNTMYYGEYITLRFIILNNTDKISVFESVFDQQRKDLSLLSFVPNDIMIVAGNPNFYICKKYNANTKFDTESISLFNKFRLESLLDVPFCNDFIRYSGSKSNPAYGKFIDQSHLRFCDLPYIFLKQYNLEKLLEIPAPPKQEQQTTNHQSDDEENSDSD
jgi:hypothetical protein